MFLLYSLYVKIETYKEIRFEEILWVYKLFFFLVNTNYLEVGLKLILLYLNLMLSISVS